MATAKIAKIKVDVMKPAYEPSNCIYVNKRARKILVPSEKKNVKKRYEKNKKQKLKKISLRKSGSYPKLTYYWPKIYKNDHRGKHPAGGWVYHRLVMRELERRSEWRRIGDGEGGGLRSPGFDRNSIAHISNDPARSKVRCIIDGYLKLYSKWQLGKILKKFHGLYVPHTYFIKNKKFVDEKPKVQPGAIWFLKPTHACQGKGIRVGKNPYHLLKGLKNKSYIMQKAVSPLLLFKGRKYDLRMWVVFVSPQDKMRINFPADSDFDPDLNKSSIYEVHPRSKNSIQAFVYKDGVVRVTIKSFNDSEKSPSLNTHLTNYAYQSRMSGYTKDKCVKAFSKMPHYNQIYANIKTALREMMPSLVQNLQSKSHKSEYWLAGVDFVIDKYLNPWLLELNCNPGVSCITKNVNIYKGSVPDLLDLAIIPLTGCGIKPKLGGYSRVY